MQLKIVQCAKNYVYSKYTHDHNLTSPHAFINTRTCICKYTHICMSIHRIICAQYINIHMHATHIYMHIHTFIYIHMYNIQYIHGYTIFKYISKYIYTQCIYMHTYTHKYLHKHIHTVYTYTCKHMHIHTYPYIYAHIYRYTRTHICGNTYFQAYVYRTYHAYAGAHTRVYATSM